MTASLAPTIWPLTCTRHKALAMGIWRCADRYDGLPRWGYPSSRRGSARYRFAADKPIKTVRQNGGWINRRLIRHDGLIGTHAWRLIGERRKAFAVGIWRCADRYDGLPRWGYPSSRRGSARYRFAADKPIKTVRQNGGWINRRLIRHDGLIGTHAWRLIGERRKAFAVGIWRCADRYDGLPRWGYPSSTSSESPDVIRLDNLRFD